MIIAMTKRAPARLPKKHRNQCKSILQTESLLLRTATKVNYNLELDTGQKWCN